MPVQFRYEEDGTVICVDCGVKVTKVLRPHWKRMQRFMAEGKTPFTDTITLGVCVSHMCDCHPKVETVEG